MILVPNPTQAELERRIVHFDLDEELQRADGHRYVIERGIVRRVRAIGGGSFTTGTQTELLYSNSTVGTAKNTFTTEAVINDTAGMGPQPILQPYFWQPSANLNVGRVLRIVARGIISVTGTPTWQWFTRLGSAASTAGPNIGSTAALTSASGISNQLWEYEIDVVLTIAGATGGNSTVRGNGQLSSSGGLGSPFAGQIFGGGATPGTVATVDISITNYINFDAACGTSSASNGITLHTLLIFGLN